MPSGVAGRAGGAVKSWLGRPGEGEEAPLGPPAGRGRSAPHPPFSIPGPAGGRQAVPRLCLCISCGASAPREGCSSASERRSAFSAWCPSEVGDGQSTGKVGRFNWTVALFQGLILKWILWHMDSQQVGLGNLLGTLLGVLYAE